MNSDKPKRKVIQIRTTDEFDRQLTFLEKDMGFRAKSPVIFHAVKELYDRRNAQRQQEKPV